MFELSPLMEFKKKKKLFVAFPWVVTSTGLELPTGTPEGSTKSGFMEKPGIEPATPGLQDIGLSPIPWRLHLIEF